MGLGWGYVSLKNIIFVLSLKKKKMVSVYTIPGTFGRDPDAPRFLLSQICVFACPVIWWHLQALPTQQCGWHCSSLHHVVSFWSWNVISSLAAPLHMGSPPPSCCCFDRCCCFSLFIFWNVLFWLCLTALNCCTPGSFFFNLYFFVCFI